MKLLSWSQNTLPYSACLTEACAEGILMCEDARTVAATLDGRNRDSMSVERPRR